MGFSLINQPLLGTPMTMESPIYIYTPKRKRHGFPRWAFDDFFAQIGIRFQALFFGGAIVNIDPLIYGSPKGTDPPKKLSNLETENVVNLGHVKEIVQKLVESR